MTGLFALWVYDLAKQQVQSDSGMSITRWEQFLSGEPNTMGDALAGFIGSLTLIWVVASVVQQSMELRAQRQEFSEMVRAQDAQVRALEAQAALFEDEKRHRAEKEISELLASLLDELAEFMSSCPKIVWKIRRRKDNLSAKLLGVEGKPEWYTDNLMLFDTLSKESFSTENALRTHFKRLAAARASLVPRAGTRKIVECPNGDLRMCGLLERLSALVDLQGKMSLADRVRFKILGIQKALEDFDLICQLPVWDERKSGEDASGSKVKQP